MKTYIILATSLFLGITLSAQTTEVSEAPSLKIMIQDVPEGESDLVVRVYQEGAFLLSGTENLVKETKLIPSGTRATIDFSGLNTGTSYAIVVFDDVNGNGKLDKSWNGRPLEAYAYTGLGKTNGTPSFSDASFELNPETRALFVQMQKVKKNNSNNSLTQKN
ncbi:MAG: hypothetical protein ACI959_000494 [Limisphaerales bacterium]|jgi:uncharacterized protein (DUF2141 family)